MKRDIKLIITTTSILATMNITSWIIFIGLCLQAGVFLFNIFYSLAINPGGAKYFPKILNMVQPFSKEVGRLIFKISFVALLVGILSLAGFQYSEWLVRQHELTV